MSTRPWLVEWSTREAAEAAVGLLQAAVIHTPSLKTEGGARPLKATLEVRPDGC